MLYLGRYLSAMQRLSVLLLIGFCLCNLSYGQGSNFTIKKNSAGAFRLGMTLGEALTIAATSNYDTARVNGWKYLVDGGGTGIEVTSNEEVLLFFWTFPNDKLLHGITIVSPRYKTAKGIGTSSTIDDLLKTNPDLEIKIDTEVTETEYIIDESLNSQLIFLTVDNNRIGKYKNGARSSKPYVLDTKIDLISFYQGSFTNR